MPEKKGEKGTFFSCPSFMIISVSIFYYALTSRRVSMGIDSPPQKITVTMEMRQVVVKNIWRASLTVLRTERAKDMAPRRPENQSMCWY